MDDDSRRTLSSNQYVSSKQTKVVRELDEMLKVRDHSRKKKDDMIKDLQQRQAQYYLDTQNSTGKLSTLGNAVDQEYEERRRAILESNYTDNNQGCCWIWPWGRRNQSDSAMRKASEGNMTAQQIKQSLTNSKEDKKKLKQIHSDEWLKYLHKNFQGLNGLRWADNLQKFMKHHQVDFKVTKFRSNIYYLKYSKQELFGSPIRQRIMSQHSFDIAQQRNSSKETLDIRRISSLMESPENIRNSDTGIRDERDSTEAITFTIVENDDLSDIYKQKEESQRLENEKLYLYSIEESKVHEIETLETMNPSTKLLYEILRQQLLEKDHPLSLISQGFAYYYSLHYSNQIIKDEKTNDYYLIKEIVENDFETQYISESQRLKIEQSFQDFEYDDDDDEFDEDDNVLFTQQFNKDTINASVRKSLRKPTFMKQANQFKKDKAIRYKSAQEALGEIKQFICIMYGSAIRFYNTVIKIEELEQMKEDIIETLTRMTFTERMAKIANAFCRICTKDEERVYLMKMTELAKLKPTQIGLNQYFTLDKSSKIKDILYEVKMQNENTGDMGGSSSESNKDNESQKKNIVDSYKEGMSHVNAITEEDEDLLQEEEKVPFRKINKKTQRSFRDQSAEKRDEDSGSSSEDNESEEGYNDNQEQSDNSNIRPTLIMIKLQRLSQSIEFRLKQQPYNLAINELKNISEALAPLEKARCLVAVSNKIVKSINKFWKGLKVKKEKLTIDGDSLLMIYIYITIKAKVLDLFAQVKFMNEFSTPFVRSTKLGYCLTTLEISLNHILNMSKEEFVNDEDSSLWNESRQSLTKSLRETLSLPNRTASLIIDENSSNYFMFESMKQS